MIQYGARRSVYLLGVMVVVSLITFFIMHQVPGGPFSREKQLSPTTLANLNAKFHLDDPLYRQYTDYMIDLLIPTITTGDQTAYSVTEDYLINIKLPASDTAMLRWINFGPSYRSQTRSVNDILREQLPVSAQLGMASLMIALAIGVPLGTLAALRKNTLYDYFSMSTAILGVSVPVIILGPLLKYVFAVELGWLPTQGWGSMEQLVMPGLCVGLCAVRAAGPSDARQPAPGSERRLHSHGVCKRTPPAPGDRGACAEKRDDSGGDRVGAVVCRVDHRDVCDRACVWHSWHGIVLCDQHSESGLFRDYGDDAGVCLLHRGREFCRGSDLCLVGPSHPVELGR